MIECRLANECEVILAFLKAEVDSPRFAGLFLPLFAQAGFSRSQLIEKADLKDVRQNAARKAILGAYRGFGRNEYLFRGFPDDVTWRLVELELLDHDHLRYANESNWVQLSDGTRLVTRLAERIDRGEIPSDPADHVKAIQKSLTSGKKFPQLIAVEGAKNTLILVEGHCRATAYVGLAWEEGIEMFLGYSPSMNRWHYC